MRRSITDHLPTPAAILIALFFVSDEGQRGQQQYPIASPRSQAVRNPDSVFINRPSSTLAFTWRGTIVARDIATSFPSCAKVYWQRRWDHHRCGTTLHHSNKQSSAGQPVHFCCCHPLPFSFARVLRRFSTDIAACLRGRPWLGNRCAVLFQELGWRFVRCLITPTLHGIKQLPKSRFLSVFVELPFERKLENICAQECLRCQLAAEMLRLARRPWAKSDFG